MRQKKMVHGFDEIIRCVERIDYNNLQSKITEYL